MSTETVGERVLAYNPTSLDTIHVFGYGTYDGDLTGGPLGDIPNPRITLDNGKIIWSCQCWWGPEDEVKEDLNEAKAEGYQFTGENF